MRALLGPIVVLAAAFAASGRGDGDARTDAEFRRATATFLAALRPPSRTLATFAFEDPRRVDWHFSPRERSGLSLGQMDDDERRAAHALLRTMMTPLGYGHALGVIGLEEVLREQERAAGGDGSYRDPSKYYWSVFGDPSGSDPWLLRVEGHHLALNFTGVADRGLVATPFFLGANPAEVLHGPHAGTKLLARFEERARSLLQALTPEQRAIALIATTAPADVLFGPGKAAPDLTRGIAFSALGSPQISAAIELATAVLGEVPIATPPAAPVDPQVAPFVDPQVAALAVGVTRFVWAGGVVPGEGHYWRLSNPAYVFEYDNTQDGANHVHALWRDPRNDFGADWLALHHATEHGSGGK